jgi:hypothetical protein
VFDGLCSGLFYGAVIATGLVVCRLCSLWSFSLLTVFGMVCGGLVGMLRSLDSKESARRIDAHYHLKDRFLTTWQILHRPAHSPMECLQQEDTATHAVQVVPQQVVPFRCPRQLVLAIAIILLAIVFQGTGNREQGTERWVQGGGKREKEKGKRENETEIFAPPSPIHSPQSSSPKETLAALSRQEASLVKRINEFNIDAVDASMREIADSLLAAEATRFTALALKAENYAKAADELEKIDVTDLPPTERNAVAEGLKQNAVAAGIRKLDNLAQSLDHLAEQLDDDEENIEDLRTATDELAEVFRTQELRKEIRRELVAKLSALETYKTQFAQTLQGKHGGDGTNPSDQPDNHWGTGSSGTAQSDQATDTVGNLRRDQLTGMHGTGPSEIETIRSDDPADTKTIRPYKNVHQEFQRISESVLESEPIPFGQRQMIRTYFERIRPKDN